MKTRNILQLVAVLAGVALTSTVYAQASDSMSMASAPAASTWKGKSTPEDKKLARDVRKALAKAQNFDVSNVFVKARGGAVLLTGSVKDGSQIAQATQVTQGVQGVSSVSNKLTLYSKGNQQ
ncbi:BON domain-containing protein [Paraburkholderia bengalensis]|jgi:hyperosmotically inducible periplasmic protein|uniref:BON domain-containing protein n=1 Tax=Paraburkholderia bengalensis TaxID=2747562 RepID=A0ABU8IP24_9BURK